MINFFKYPLIYPYTGNIRSTRLLGINTLPCQSPISIEHVYLIHTIIWSTRVVSWNFACSFNCSWPLVPLSLPEIDSLQIISFSDLWGRPRSLEAIPGKSKKIEIWVWQRSFEVNRGHWRPLEDNRGQHRPLAHWSTTEANRDHWRTTEATWSQQRPLKAHRGHLRPTEAKWMQFSYFI